MACGGGGKRCKPLRFRGNGRQGRHFHGEAFDGAAECGTGFGQQGCLMQPEPAGPGRIRRQEDEASGTDVRETRLAGDRGGQEVAQSSIQSVERARAIRERAEGDALGRRLRAGGGTDRMVALRHDEYDGGVRDMNIIIVGKRHSAPFRIDLDSRRGRALAAAAVAGCALFCAGIGFAMALLLDDPRARNLEQVAAMRAQLTQQRAALVSLDADSHRDLDALALQLGKLQAQATRLNALGERLTQVGKLDDGEFDFASAPAMGGPEEPASGLVAALPIQQGVDALRAAFDQQEAQLDVLENLLRDRKIDNALLPRGMPVAQGYISSGFGARSDPFDGHSATHLGLDFDSPFGADVMAVADGVVTWSGERSGYGNVVEIDHGNGYMTRYAHNSANLAQVGARVRAGQPIALVGSTGRSTGPHCHFEVWLDGKPLNPLAFVQSKRTPRG